MPTQELWLDCTPPELLLAGGWPRPFLLDGGGPASWGSGVAVFGHSPRARVRIDASGTAEWVSEGARQRLDQHPFAVLETFRRTHAARVIDAPAAPFAGGLVAMLSYDLKHWIERLPGRARDDQALPVLECGWYDWALVFDYRTQGWSLASSFLSADALHAVGEAIRERIRTRLAPVAATAAAVTSNFSRAGYLSAVRRALAYIAAGDIYQVNLAQRFCVASPGATAAGFFARLQQHPMPFAGYVDCGDFAVVSNSPECWLRLTPESIATFPIKGTRSRGADTACDIAAVQALCADAKEGAEHVMIVDLERNDLGRVCEPGSVAVGSLAAVQSYPTLHHLVSEVHGRLRPATSFTDVLRALFPGGSVTGAPKIRAMEIIDELEPVRRGVYTGAIGFLDAHGTGTFNIAIRTAIARGGQLTYHAGGAIVADSDPDREYEETLLKARAFFTACGVSGPT